ncbi:IS4 family transposase [Pontibacillus chungwhensis]|uniref:IS4 family transposase n=1 Tax=Pontibacillus chungwhensis TaxID=265426 RepID=A0ABY8V1A4_9BACI|nr:IS4 family transposase [Pontibacillus chungwhensis]WIF97646.1 IS4 family transposase [Pontibacillus chungwhensis]
MNKINTPIQILQSIIPSKTLEDRLAQEYNFEEKARKFSAIDLLHFYLEAGVKRWTGYREGSETLVEQGNFESLNHSTISKKAQEVPYEFFRDLFQELLQRLTTSQKKKFLKDYSLFAIDSTTITFRHQTRSWAKYRKHLYAIKLHTEFNIDQKMPTHVFDTTGKDSDIMMAPLIFLHKDFPAIRVADRAYGAKDLLDQLSSEEKPFVIRLKAGIKHDVQSHNEFDFNEEWPVVADYNAFLGAKNTQTTYTYRIVTVPSETGEPIYLATNVMDLKAEKISEVYKMRWEIELFFRWIKQNLDIPNPFGMSKNKVLSQVYATLIAYLLLRSTFNETQPKWSTYTKLSFKEFTRKFIKSTLPIEVGIEIGLLLKNWRSVSNSTGKI